MVIPSLEIVKKERLNLEIYLIFFIWFGVLIFFFLFLLIKMSFIVEIGFLRIWLMFLKYLWLKMAKELIFHNKN
jgi:hypothetical protein